MDFYRPERACDELDRRFGRCIPLCLALLVATACGSAQDREAGPMAAGALRGKNLLVITLDTTRRDHISAYGVPGLEGTTPAIDRLAAQGALFENAYSQTNTTNPSHTSLFTGLYALDTRIMNNHSAFEDVAADIDTLPAAFQRAGYRTGGFAAVAHLSKQGLALPGFDEANVPPGELRASQIVPVLIRWIQQDRTRPFFAWLHLFDPHIPYRPPAKYRALYYQGDPTAGDSTPLGESPSFKRSAPKPSREQFGKVRDRRYPAAMYRGEIRFLDDQLGRLLRALEKLGLSDDTAIVLLGDHGESLGEHEIYYDHAGLYEESIRIPFIVRLPGFPAGVRITERVGQIDLAPTLVELFDVNLESTTPLRGLSLAEALRGKQGTALTGRDWMIHESASNHQIAVRRGPWKAIYSVWFMEPPVLLFDLEQDPKETHNLAKERPELVEELRVRAQPWLDEGRWKIGTEAFEKALGERLRALGYLPGDDD